MKKLRKTIRASRRGLRICQAGARFRFHNAHSIGMTDASNASGPSGSGTATASRTAMAPPPCRARCWLPAWEWATK